MKFVKIREQEVQNCELLKSCKNVFKMPVQRTNIKKGKFSNYGSSIFSPSTKNTQYFQTKNTKQPTVRGSFPKAVRWSLDDEGITNRRLDYSRGQNLNRSAANNRPNISFGASQKIASATMSSNIYAGQPSAGNVRLSNINYFTGGRSSASAFDGNAARKVTARPKKMQAATEPAVHAVKGAKPERSVFYSTAMSPMLLTLAKVAVAVIIVMAIMAFVRVAMTSATVSTGLNSQAISAQIDNQLIEKNALEVQDSALSNSSRVRQAAAQHNLVLPTKVETIYLDKDILDYSGDKISLVGSLNNLANIAK